MHPLRRGALVLALATSLASACRHDEGAASSSPAGAAAPPVSSNTPQPAPAGVPAAVPAPGPPVRLTTAGGEFRREGEPFEWRGLTAFRLVEMIAAGREGEAAAFLDFAAARGITVVRVLLMARHLFPLDPQQGVRALPRLLELAAARGLYVEAVALADTAAIGVDLERHVEAVGRAAAAAPNALVEIANEPWHPTQDPRLHDPATVARLAALVPEAVPVALGSAETDAGYARGDYATWHSPRGSGDGGWQHVIALSDGARLEAEWDRPVVSDEPMGAAAGAIPGRRDNDPARFAAAAALTRLAGLDATFHYEGGLQAAVPAGAEGAALDAWIAGLDLLRGLPSGGRFLQGPALDEQATVTGARAAFGRIVGDALWVLLVDPAPDASVRLAGGWRVGETRNVPGARLVRGSR